MLFSPAPHKQQSIALIPLEEERSHNLCFSAGEYIKGIYSVFHARNTRIFPCFPFLLRTTTSPNSVLPLSSINILNHFNLFCCTLYDIFIIKCKVEWCGWQGFSTRIKKSDPPFLQRYEGSWTEWCTRTYVHVIASKYEEQQICRMCLFSHRVRPAVKAINLFG